MQQGVGATYGEILLSDAFGVQFLPYDNGVLRLVEGLAPIAVAYFSAIGSVRFLHRLAGIRDWLPTPCFFLHKLLYYAEVERLISLAPGFNLGFRIA